MVLGVVSAWLAPAGRPITRQRDGTTCTAACVRDLWDPDCHDFRGYPPSQPAVPKSAVNCPTRCLKCNLIASPKFIFRMLNRTKDLTYVAVGRLFGNTPHRVGPKASAHQRISSHPNCYILRLCGMRMPHEIPRSGCLSERAPRRPCAATSRTCISALDVCWKTAADMGGEFPVRAPI